MTPIQRAIRSALAALLLLLGLLPAAAAQGGASAWSDAGQSEVRLVAGSAGVGDRQTVQLGLQFRMQPGWKIYWRSPGDAGLPPVVDWSASRNLAAAAIAWPAPHRFSLFGLETMGYSDEVVLPVTARLQDPGQSLALAAHVQYLTCSEICVPVEADLALDLPAGSAVASPFAGLIGRYRDRVPGDGAASGLRVEAVRVAAADGGALLRVRAVSTAAPFAAPDVFVEGPEGVAFGAPRIDVEDRKADFAVPVFGDPTQVANLAGKPFTLTVVDGERAAEATLMARPDALAVGETDLATLAGILLFALLGGLILNLMPCVLPVLSLKLLAFAGHGGGERGLVRAGFLASAAGIVFSFWLLAGLAIGLKAAGMAVGWGLHFQQPLFVVTILLVLTLFAANLWGLFEIHLPRWLADVAERATTPNGASGHGARHLGGHFLTGAFATLLATPCSAPFLGTAVGFALARGGGEILAVFTALGIGLALPYLLVAALPGLATALPRPGAWMLRLRWILGGALALTALWLLAVLSAQRGAEPATAIGAMLALVVAVLAVRKYLPEARLARLAPVAVAILAVAALATPFRFPATGPNVAAKPADGRWVAFDEAAIPGLVAAGRTVLVDVTAEWCLTCQVNKAAVLDRGEVAAMLRDGDIVAMQADWTRPDDRIARYLQRFGRYGIPFNAVYGPAAPDGIALPELLTSDAVLQAFAAARSKAVARQ